ncbi:LOW QUALITY PROTEIN: uncharacterized protein LY79DRAFT_595175 [Colletotrichum navitas]|uniref:Uncharacterized protein n=1 Tax=Colletotrichum navitas TaxID=681940 RepID=A0AAD8UX27_9PEZI|nr:LOW QUALITY PROTEIN: uncharacterized protein LY79DRAFT_595175 [Colletotrichum navitas]KAK1565968.1 LOW QUALITY PROTEIN: hypothetical protein LY79DRAFT_595175 [Colletotrichum navitas]
MIWALDQIDQDSSIGGSMTPEEMEEAEAIYQDEAAKGVCYTTMCDDKCRTGDHEAAQMRGQPGLLSTMSRCPKDQVRRLYCSKRRTMGTCKCRGFRGLELSCTGGCADGETEFKDEAADLALEAAETLALEIAAKDFCRVAIMAATLPLRLIPFVGWIASIALQVAMPALGVAKAGKSFKGKDYEVKPLTSKADRPATKSPTKASEKPKTCKTKRLAARAFRNLKSYGTPECNGERAKQACYNYSSVIARRRDLQSLTCPSNKALRAPRPIVGVWNDQHHTSWSSGWLQQADLECERDEYPGGVWIRLIPATDNSRAAWLFGGCPEHEQERLVGERSITTKVMETINDIQFTRMGNMPPDFGITTNPCWPKTLVDDPGFALLTNDSWYRQGNNRGAFIQFYDDEPGPQFTNGKVNHFPGRRALDELDHGKRSPAELVIREGNSTRRPTHCQREMEELGYASLPVIRETATSPATAEAVATPSITGSFPEASIEVPASLSYALEVAAEISDAARSIITPAPGHNPTI